MQKRLASEKDTRRFEPASDSEEGGSLQRVTPDYKQFAAAF